MPSSASVLDVRRQLVRGSTAAFGLRGIELVINYAVHLLLAGWLSAAGYGVYSYVVALVGLLAVLGQLGLHTAIMRFVAASRAQEAWGRLRGALIVSNRLAVASSVTITVVAEGALWLRAEAIDDGLRVALQVGMLLVPLTVLSGLRQRALRGLKLILASQFPETIVIPVVMIVGVLAAQAMGAVNPVVAVAIRVIAVGLAFVVGAVWLIRALPEPVKRTPAEYRLREILAVSVPMMFASSMQIVFGKVDTLMLGYFGEMTDVGVYNLALRVAMFASFGRVAVTLIAAPLIAETYARGNRGQLQRIVSLSSLGTTVYALVVCVAAVLGAPWFLGTFGAEFSLALVPLLILLVTEVVENVLCLVNPLLTMTAYQGVFSRVVLGALAMNIVLNALLIPAYGIVGAAVATTISTICWKACTGYLVVRHLKINPTLADPAFLQRLVRQAASAIGLRS